MANRCVHGLSQNCEKCFHETDFCFRSFAFTIRERMDCLEENIIGLSRGKWPLYEVLADKIEKLENDMQMKNRAIPTDIMNRLISIENFIGQNYERDKMVIEAKINSKYKILSECMIKLDKKFDDLEQLYLKITERPSPYTNKPHKCPVCDGQGCMNVYVNKESGLMALHKCNPCEGKGIIWG